MEPIDWDGYKRVFYRDTNDGKKLEGWRVHVDGWNGWMEDLVQGQIE